MAESWWTYAYILIAGWLATDLWRWFGVLAGSRLDNDSEALNWVRAVATALVAAVISKLILYPTGILALSPVWLRLGAAGIGIAAYFSVGQRVVVGVAAAVLSLAVGLHLLGF